MPSALFVRKNEMMVRVPLGEIMYVMAAGSYLKLITSKNQFTLSQNLREFTRRNEIPQLVRVHRSYLINIDQVQAFDHATIYLGSGTIPIGARYRASFLKAVRCI